MPPARRQVEFDLPPDLVGRAQTYADDTGVSLSDLVTRALTAELARTSETPRFRPMVHVTDMPAAVAFYEALGCVVQFGSRDGDWVLLRLGETEVGLLAHPPNPEQNEGAVELNVEVGADLDEFEARLRAAGVPVARSTRPEQFGRQLLLTDPDGRLVKVNETHPAQFA